MCLFLFVKNADLIFCALEPCARPGVKHDANGRSSAGNPLAISRAAFAVVVGTLQY